MGKYRITFSYHLQKRQQIWTQKKQMALIECLSFKGKSAAKLHKNIYGSTAFEVSTVKSWVCKIKSNSRENWETDLSDGSPRGRSTAAVNEHKSQSAGVFITHARRIAIEKLCKHSGNSGKGLLKEIYKMGCENADWFHDGTKCSCCSKASEAVKHD